MGWHWLSEAVVMAVHGEQLAEHGGGQGVRDAGLLSSALARPKNHDLYREPSVFDLAGAYAFGIIRSHPFVDGNKRTGFLAAYVFLDLNGWELTATEAEAVSAVLALARGDMDEAGFAAWLQSRCIPRTDRD
jgi:death-on-curing protein